MHLINQRLALVIIMRPVIVVVTPMPDHMHFKFSSQFVTAQFKAKIVSGSLVYYFKYRQIWLTSRNICFI